MTHNSNELLIYVLVNRVPFPESHINCNTQMCSKQKSNDCHFKETKLFECTYWLHEIPQYQQTYKPL